MKIIATILFGVIMTTSHGQIISAGVTPVPVDGIAHLQSGSHYICQYDQGFLMYDSAFNLVSNVAYPFMLDFGNLPNRLADSSTDHSMGPGYLSNTLFDNDANTVEYLYQTWSSSPSNHFYIVAQIGGGILFALPSDYAHRGIINTQNGAKWVTIFNDGNLIAGHIWALPGLVPCPDCDGTVNLLNDGNDHQMESITPLDAPNISYKLYPNPTDGLLNIDLEFPEDVQTATFVIRDQKSVEVKSIVINSSGTHQVNLENVSPGVYVTELVGPNGRIGPGQLVVVE